MTRLLVAGKNMQIILDHSAQSVVVRDQGGDKLIFTCNNDRPRLTNHYIGVFQELARQIDSGIDNFSYCKALHEILFDAEEWSQ